MAGFRRETSEASARRNAGMLRCLGVDGALSFVTQLREGVRVGRAARQVQVDGPLLPSESDHVLDALTEAPSCASPSSAAPAST